MSRLIISLVILIMYSIPSTKAQTLSIGPVLGANYSKLTEVANAKSRLGISGGVFANYSINEHFGLNVKLIYSQLGTKIDNSTSSVRLSYIQLPLSAVYFFGEAGNTIRPKIFIGPYVGYLLSAKDGEGNEFVDSNGDNYYNKIDFGGQIGAGFNYRIKSRTWLNVDAAYSSSLSKLSDAFTIKTKNTAISINIGVSFPVNGAN